MEPAVEVTVAQLLAPLPPPKTSLRSRPSAITLKPNGSSQSCSGKGALSDPPCAFSQFAAVSMSESAGPNRSPNSSGLTNFANSRDRLKYSLQFRREEDSTLRCAFALRADVVTQLRALPGTPKARHESVGLAWSNLVLHAA
jgi:hypothetical protein